MDKKERVRKYGEVFTPQWVVDRMCDELPDNAFEPARTFLEPACGEGVFVLEILRRKFKRCKSRKDYSTAIASVYAMEIQPQNVEETIRAVTELCKKYFDLTKADIETINNHVILCDSLKVMRMMNDSQLWKSEEE